MKAEGRLSRPKLRFERDFTQLPNAWLRDDMLSLKARGLLAMLMSHEAGWNVTIKSLAATNPEGLDAIRTAVVELEEYGYLVREQTRTTQGRLGHVWWTLTDPAEAAEARKLTQLELSTDWDEKQQNPRSEPSSGFPVSDNPIPDKPSSDNPTTKEEHLKEHLPIEVKNPTIGAHADEEDALPRGPHPVATESSADRYRRLINAKCPGRKHPRAGHVWLTSGYCEWCGDRQPELEDERELVTSGASS